MKVSVEVKIIRFYLENSPLREFSHCLAEDTRIPLPNEVMIVDASTYRVVKTAITNDCACHVVVTKVDICRKCGKEKGKEHECLKFVKRK